MRMHMIDKTQDSRPKRRNRSGSSERPPFGRRILLWSFMLAIPFVVAPVVLVQAWFLYGYLGFQGGFCGPFGRLDGEIGWTLSPGVQSCIIGKTAPFGEVAFRGEVSIDERGARVPESALRAADAESMPLQVIVMGDSWPFGYGIDGVETFASRLTRDHGYVTALFASPAYSNAQAILLADRMAQRYRPKAFVYLTAGLERAVCVGGAEPRWILKPCYWTAPDGQARLVTPPPGLVDSAASFGLRPGGMLGAGEMTLGYFLISRPISKVNSMLVKLGIISGTPDDFRGSAPPDETEAIRRASFADLRRLIARHGAKMVLLDPGGTYDGLADDAVAAGEMVYVGNRQWREEISLPSEALPLRERVVPYDGHYGRGVHAMIGDMVSKQLRTIGLHPAK